MKLWLLDCFRGTSDGSFHWMLKARCHLPDFSNEKNILDTNVSKLPQVTGSMRKGICWRLSYASLASDQAVRRKPGKYVGQSVGGAATESPNLADIRHFPLDDGDSYGNRKLT
jgi:hypothetical protein